MDFPLVAGAGKSVLWYVDFSVFRLENLLRWLVLQ